MNREQPIKHKFQVSIKYEADRDFAKEFVEGEVWMTREEYYDLIASFKDKKISHEEH